MTAHPSGREASRTGWEDWLLAPQVRHVRRLEGQPGASVPWPDWVSERVRAGFGRTGVLRPWRHQVEAAELARAGRHVVLGTGTASGKSLGYLLPVLAATYDEEGPPARPSQPWSPTAWRRRPHTALYLSPTKALAHDQLRSYAALGLDDWAVAAVNGDSSPAERDWARDYGTYVLTNPDLLHYSLLPNHARWALFLQSLRYVVVDEAHRYSGAFGTQVALVLRRLRRLAARYDAQPVFVLASATVVNATAAAAALLGVRAEDVAVVSDDTSARGPVDVVLWESRASPEEETAELLASCVHSGRQTVAFVPSRRQTELVAARARQLSGLAHIASYRAGYLAEDRRRLERELQDGTLRGVAATNALELGVDIAGVDTVLLCGYPGTRAAFWQQAGRAGRRGTAAQAVLVTGRSPLEAYILDHPEVVLDQPVEATVLQPDNPYVVAPQLAAAAQEQPLTDDDSSYFGPGMRPVLDRLVAGGVLRRRPTGWFWPHPERAVDNIDLRGAGRRSVEIVEDATGRVLGHLDATTADLALHPGAVYLHQGETFLSRYLDLDAGEAVVRPAQPGYLTQPQVDSRISVVATSASRQLGHGVLHLGEVTVRSQVTGFQRRDALTGHLWEEIPLDLPPHEARTTAVWWTLERRRVDPTVGWARLDAAVHASEHVCLGLMPVFIPCDRWDVGSSADVVQPDSPRLTVYFHDRQPGGTGFAAHAYEAAEAWLGAAADRVRTCGCDTGCPACVLSPTCGGRRGLDKAGAAHLLGLLTGRRFGPLAAARTSQNGC